VNSLKKRTHLLYVGIGRRIILKWILKEKIPRILMSSLGWLKGSRAVNTVLGLQFS
jgi:hypothetical protein